MPDYHINHVTRYLYPSTVIDCTNQVMLYPVNDQQQLVKNHELKVSGDPSVEEFRDYFGNTVGMFSLVKPHRELTILSSIEVVTSPVNVPANDSSPESQWEELVQVCETYPYIDFLQQEVFIAASDIRDLLDHITGKDKTVFENVQLLNEYVYKHFEYKKGVTNVETKVDQILKLKAGVCQDFAHVLLVFLRILGIPSRYVSGYICPKDHELRGEGATHAWVETFIPFYGWLGFDPTNNCIASDRHVRLAIGRNFSDCTPVKGTYKGSSEHTLEVSVSIENGTSRKNKTEETPVFTYRAHNPGVPDNSYRRHMEMQQQQQQ